MQSWNKIIHYAGFDWAHDYHEVVIVNRSGKIVADPHALCLLRNRKQLGA